MKRIALLVLPALLFFACKKDKVPYTENITSGEKWGLEIGSSYADVYSRLQTLGAEKNFTDVALVYQQPFSNPAEIKDRLAYYSSITLMKKTGAVQRAMIVFPQDKINAIEAGGSLPDEVSQWPGDVPDEIAFRKDDPVAVIYDKLAAIYEQPAYRDNYEIILPDKPLAKPYDPGMAKYNEWAFTFFVDVNPGTQGRSSVRLFFENGRLSRIRHDYTEADVYN